MEIIEQNTSDESTLNENQQADRCLYSGRFYLTRRLNMSSSAEARLPF
jgi:hypothetical protein